MEASAEQWIGTLRSSQDRLRALVEPLDVEQLGQASYDPGWSIAQVLSHLGSQTVLFGALLDAGLSGEDPPAVQELMAPVWAEWDAKDPESQGQGVLQANEALTRRFESLDQTELERIELQLWGMSLDTAALARMRLIELALHSWDVATVLDPSATVDPAAVALIVDTLGDMTARAGKPGETDLRVHVTTSDPERHFTLATAGAVSIVASEPDGALAQLRLPAEAFIRLVCGRLDAEHTPALEISGVDLDELRQVFPGF
jgi:uncharacterized protein (TIGR03083 family)